jgi:hypothetical protein
MRVDYYCSGINRFSEFIQLDHGSYSGYAAKLWWRQRLPPGWPEPPDVHTGYAQGIKFLKEPKEITVAMGKKYNTIIGYNFDD